MKALPSFALLTLALACGQRPAVREAQVLLPSSEFFSRGQPVFLHGVSIGQLERLRPHGDSVVATLSLSRSDVHLRRGDRLQVVVSPIGGPEGMTVVDAIVDVRLDLVQAPVDSPLLGARDTLYALPTKRLDSAAMTIVKGAKELLRLRKRD
jgi:hypothetical protein